MHICRAFFSIYLIGALLPSALHLQAQTPNPAQAPNLKKFPSLKKADAAFHAGFAARQSGNLELARTKFAEAVKLAPQIPEGHEALGAVLLELGRPAEAVPEFEAAAKLKPADAEIESSLALAYAQAGEPAKALPHFSAAIEKMQEPGQTPANAAFH